MSGWNEIILKKIDTYSHRILTRVEEGILFVGTYYTTHKGIFLITLIIFCLLYILLTLWYKYREFNFPLISNFLYHISIVYGIGLLLSSVPKNVKWIGLVLELAPVLFIIPIFLAVLYVRDRMLYWKSHTKHQMKLVHGFYMIGLVAIPFTIISPKWETVDFLNWAIVLLFLFYLSHSVRLKSTTNSPNYTSSEESDQEVVSSDQLFPTRRRELERIKGYMTSQQYQEPFALAINAPFGEGKSSLIQVLTAELKNDNNKVLFLKPTITDNKDKLITYFFGQLEILLKESGIYTGQGSALRKYVEQFGKLIDNNKFDAFLDLLGFFEKEKKEEYRETKRRLEEDIKQMLSSSTKENIKRLYIVVDDFDRAEENTMHETLIFIKELVDFKYCGVLFLMNYDLVVIGEKISRDYLDKFIGKRFDLEKIRYSEIFNYYIIQSQLLSLKNDDYIDFIKDEMNLLQIHAMSYLDQAERGLFDNFESLKNLHQINSQNKKEENMDSLKKSKSDLEEAEKDLKQFKDKLNNPRRLKRILREIKEAFLFLNSIYREKSTPFLAENAKRTELHRIIFNISIIKYLYEDEYDQIIKSGDIVSYLYTYDSYLISKHLLSNIKRTYRDESEEILKQIKIKFYHLFLFQRLEGEEYLQEIITQTAQRLIRLDSSTPLTTQENTSNEIVLFLDAIKRESMTADLRITRERLKKIYDALLFLLKEEKLPLNDLLDFIDRKFISIDLLVIEHSFLKDLLKVVIAKPLIFTNESEKTELSYKINKLEEAIILYFKGDINLIISIREAIFQIQYSNTNELEFVKDLFELNNFLEDISYLERAEDEEIDELDWFRINTEKLLDVSQIQEIKPKTLKAIDYCRNRVNILLNLLTYHKNLLHYWSQGKFKTIYEIKPKYLTSLEDVTKSVNSIYQQVISQDLVDTDLSELYEYFHLTVVQVRKIVQGESLPESTIKILNSIYEKLDELYVVNIYEERHWRNCGLLLEKITFLD